MWHTLRSSLRASPDLVSANRELIESSSRYMICATGCLYLAWHLIATITWPQELGSRVWAVSFVVALASGLSLGLLYRHPLVAHCAWLVGLAVAITLAVYIFHRAEISFLLSILPFMAGITLGWRANLLTGALVLGCCLWLADGPGAHVLPVPYALAVMVGSLVTGTVAWAGSRTFYTVIEWHIDSFEQARRNMESARQHRAQLAKVVKALDEANYRLARANAALVSALRAADEAERFRAQFATHVSHELRTPLNLIIGFSEMMVASPENYGESQIPGAYRRDLDAIYQSARHLLTLVDDVLDMARIEVGKTVLSREEVDLASLIAEATAMAGDYIAAKGLELRVEVASALPRVWIDRLRIRQVLLNLLMNAARFTERGRIAIEASWQGEEVMIRVTDTGRGIPKEELPGIFQEFHSTQQPPAGWPLGTGLGLPISKKLVELHHGRMGVHSTYLQGSCFWFTLPCTQDAGLKPQPGALVRTRAVHLGEPEQILVVLHEDAAVASLLQRYLEGYRVAGASSAPAAEALVEELKATAILLDADSPEQPSASHIPVLSCRLPSSRKAAQAMGVRALLVKPVSQESLRAAIDGLGRPVHRILIVDDDPDMVRLLRRMLAGRQPPTECLEAYDGEQALESMRVHKPDLVLLDLIMPRVPGTQVLARMAADPTLSTIPAIVISAQGEEYFMPLAPTAVQILWPDALPLGRLMRMLQGVLEGLRRGSGE